MAFTQKQMMYRARIFANGLYVMTVNVPERGQRFIKATVYAPNFGLFGEKTQIAFMINRKIKPKIFDGHIMEIDFDIQDATQIGDLLDVCPEFVNELTQNFHKFQEVRKEATTIDAQFTISEENKNMTHVMDALLEDPVKAETKQKSEENPNEEEDERPIDKVIRNTKSAFEIASTAFPYLPGIRDIKNPDIQNTDEKITKIINLCNKSPAHKKCLYWIADYLGVDKEVKWIVSQSRPIRIGIDPSYYKHQSGAAISEKVLSQPKVPEGWQTVVLILGIVGMVVLGIALIMHGGF